MVKQKEISKINRKECVPENTRFCLGQQFTIFILPFTTKKLVKPLKIQENFGINIDKIAAKFFLHDRLKK